MQILPFPNDVISGMREISDEVIRELAESDPLAQRIYDSFTAFGRQIGAWAELTERQVYTGFQGG